jgi:hypothetical protein
MTDTVVKTAAAVRARATALRARGRSILSFVVMAAMTIIPGSCARSPTVVLTEISVDATVPAIVQLRTTAALQTDPSQRISNMLSSLFRGAAPDRPAPYVFPMRLPIQVPPAWMGPVMITIEGLDWDTSAVNAAGSTTAEVVAAHQTSAALTLTGVASTTSPDGGADDDAAADVAAEPTEDAGDDAMADL